MPRHGAKHRVGLTISPEVWQECRQRSKELDINWSQVAEDAFVAVLGQLTEIERLIASAPPGSSTALIKTYLKAYVGDEFACSYKEIEDKFSPQS